MDMTHSWPRMILSSYFFFRKITIFIYLIDQFDYPDALLITFQRGTNDVPGLYFALLKERLVNNFIIGGIIGNICFHFIEYMANCALITGYIHFIE